MPAGVPVGTLAIGQAGAKNAALLAIAILANSRPELAKEAPRFSSEADQNRSQIQTQMTIDEVMDHLASLGRPDVVASMAKFGISTPKSFGIKTPDLKQFAREVKKQAADRHELAGQLWATGNYDARAVAFLIDDPKQVTAEQMDAWAADFDNWATVDGTCCYLFCRTPFAYEKAVEWGARTGIYETCGIFTHGLSCDPR